uniref:Uncharacterized protein n=1 Tax=Rhizophagus irregularis (strain DAOM 181602 / DAOM 197198 / MUCL 43194) TaxID=747089 RepID=U9T2V2_RHIID
MSRPSEIARQIDEIVYHIKGKKVRIQKEREAIEQDKRERNELMKGRDKLEDEIEELKLKIDREQSRISKKEKEVEGMINNIKGLVNDLVKIKEEYEKGMRRGGRRDEIETKGDVQMIREIGRKLFSKKRLRVMNWNSK